MASTAAVVTAVPVAPAVRLVDATGNSIPGVAVTFAPSTGSGSVLPATPVTTSATGTATLTSWTLGNIAAPQSLIVSSAGVPSVTINATAVPGPAALLATVTPPSAAALSGVPFAAQPVIQLEDAQGNARPQAGVPVTAVVATGAGTLGGTLTVNTDTAGRATFTNLRLNGVIGNRTLGFTSPGLTATTPTAVTLSAGPAAKLVYSVNPTSAAAGAAITPAVAVTVLDADNNTVTTAGNSIALAITAGTGAAGAALSGATTVAAVNGVATFPGVSINLVGLAYTLTATSTGLTQAVSTAFDVQEILSSVSPTAVDAVFATMPMVLTGSVANAVAVTVSGGNVTTANLAHVNLNTLTIDFNIAGGAPTSTPSVTFTTPAGVSNGLPLNLFSVGTAPVQLGAANGGGGGNAYSLDCPVGSVATGLNASGGTNVDNIQVICQR